MKIDRLSGARTSSKRRSGASSATGDGGFAKALAGSTSQSQGSSAAAPAQTVNALLALQEVGDATEQPSKGRQRAEDILDQLEDLRLSLVLGSVSIGKLEQLADLLAQREDDVEDPKLAEIINEIEIRAAVELAKRGR
ncbi:flagellar assembly protein FliX [Pelagibius litoralis]|uniref:Flagellar assembly protein FliX n=1 Tax=Pelagibius litoralis TaxID=374515 RepID=A0A967EXX2_9PROT|nr:flagellar assembly protein FliX [Pelagibius litoralis]NIA69457.1 flagellar assembly protein FliX [Pelagibius litoralis]